MKQDTEGKDLFWNISNRLLLYNSLKVGELVSIGVTRLLKISEFYNVHEILENEEDIE